MKALLLLLLALALPAHAEGDTPGDFDYYVVALSWSPTWCALTGDARRHDQCDARHAHGFILHGLWPQYGTGYPSDCRSPQRDPSRGQHARSRGLHKFCSAAGHPSHRARKGW